jgi:phage terminase small subunit
MTDDAPKLTKKQQVFIDEYLKCFNGAEAARRAGYSESRARITASELLADSNVSEQIKARLAEVHMGADEALKLTADIARGDIAQLMDISSVGFSLDMSKAKEAGLTGLIKKVKQKTVTHIAKSESDEDREVVELEIELYDKQSALRDILKISGKFIEKVDLSNSDGSLRPEKETDDTRAEILRKLDSIATATGAGAVRERTESETTG